MSAALHAKQFLEGERITRTFEAVIKSIDEENHTVEVCVSDASLDRHEEIISLSAWAKRLKSYLENPILCWGHPLSPYKNAGPEDLIGKALWVEVRADGLWCKFQYAVKENPRAALIWALVSGGYLKAFSIGAIVWACVYCWDDDEAMANLTAAEREALKSGACWCVITDAELLEVSQVFVGSNRSALARAMQAGLVTREVAKSLIGGPVMQVQPAKKDAADAAATPAAPAEAQPAAEAAQEAAAPATVEESAADESAQFEKLMNDHPEFAKAFGDLVGDLFL